MLDKETIERIARIAKNAPKSMKGGETIMHLPPLAAGPSARLKFHWGQLAHEAKLQRLAKESRQNPSPLPTNELKPTKIK